MRNIKCADCAEYRNEWCEKVIDSPYPDALRECQYYHEKDRDLVRVVRCKDCRYWDAFPSSSAMPQLHECHAHIASLHTAAHEYCSRAERREG